MCASAVSRQHSDDLGRFRLLLQARVSFAQLTQAQANLSDLAEQTFGCHLLRLLPRTTKIKHLKRESVGEGVDKFLSSR